MTKPKLLDSDGEPFAYYGGMHKLSKAPDGVPHAKCCSVCTCRKALFNKSRIDDCPADSRELFYSADPQYPLYCVHRKDADGNHRICAGWAAFAKSGVRNPVFRSRSKGE